MTQLAVIYLSVVGWFRDRANEERGASIVEYALLLALIALVAVTAMSFLGHTVANSFNNLAAAP